MLSFNCFCYGLRSEDGVRLFLEMLSGSNGHELQWKSILALRRRVVHSKRGQLQNQDIEAVASPF